MIRMGPMKGLNERLDARLIGDTELAKADNAYNRSGQIAPRPGFDEVVADSLGIVVRRLTDTLATNPLHIAVDAVHGYIFWTSGSDLYRMVVATGAITSIFTASDAVTGITVDTTNSLLYFCETVAEKVRKCALDGTSDADVYSSESGGLGAIRYDSVNDQLYWVRVGTGIRKAPRTPGAASTHISSANAGTLTTISGLDVSPTAGKLVWKDTAASSVKTADISAANTNVTTIISSVTGNGIATDGTYVYYSPTAATIYRATLAAGASAEAMLTQTGFVTLRAFCYNSTYARLFFNNNISPSGPTVSYVYSMVVSLATAYPVVTEWYRRQILGVDQASYFCKDIVWTQIINTATSNTELSILFPSLGIQKSIPLGYFPFTSISDGNPTTWATDDRDSDPTYFDPFSTSSARLSFSWRGKGIDTGEGGWLAVQDGIVPRNLNYVLSDTIWTITQGGDATSTFHINFDGQSTSVLDGSVTANLMRVALCDLPNINGCAVSRSGGGPYTWTIRMHGVWSGQNTPELTVTEDSDGGAATTYTVARAQTGGLDTAASGYVGPMVYCRPVGLPTPETGPSTSYDVSGDTVASGTALDIGYYSFRVTWYSSRWNLESPPSNAFGDLTSDYVLITTAGTDELALITINAFPSTLYFNDAAPFRHIDYMRVYARRWGTALSGGVPDGVGAWDDWYQIGEHNMGQASAGSTFVWDGDPADNTGIRCPFENGYPPNDAKIGCIHNDRAFYAATDHNLWFSSLTNNRGEMGHEYVGTGTQNFIQILEYAKNDAGFTACFSFADRLIVSDPSIVFALETSGIDQGIVVSERMRGAIGIANNWVCLETESLPDLQGYMLMVSPRGHIYLFDGASNKRISQKLLASVNDVHRKHWVEDTYFESGLATAYYATACLWPEENSIIVSTFDKAGTAYNLVYNIEFDAWCKWDLGGFGWTVGREWTGTDKGKDIVVFGKAGGKLYRLGENYDDNGSSFSTDIRSKRFDMKNAFMKNTTFQGGAAFQVRQQSASQTTDPTVTVSAITEGQVVTTQNTTLTQSPDYIELAVVPAEGSAHTLQIKVVDSVGGSNGTRTEKVPEIIGFGFEHGGETGAFGQTRGVGQ